MFVRRTKTSISQYDTMKIKKAVLDVFTLLPNEAAGIKKWSFAVIHHKAFLGHPVSSCRDMLFRNPENRPTYLFKL